MLRLCNKIKIVRKKKRKYVPLWRVLWHFRTVTNSKMHMFANFTTKIIFSPKSANFASRSQFSTIKCQNSGLSPENAVLFKKMFVSHLNILYFAWKSQNKCKKCKHLIFAFFCKFRIFDCHVVFWTSSRIKKNWPMVRKLPFFFL